MTLRTADETLTWHSPHEPPDADETVLVFMPDADEPVDFGCWDGENWCCASLDAEGEIQAWAHMPEGRIP
jgi:hypothetical protein